MPVKLYRYGLCLLFSGILMLGLPQVNKADRATLLKQYRAAVSLYEKSADFASVKEQSEAQESHHAILVETRRNFDELLNQAADGGYDSLAFHASLRAGMIARELNDDPQARYYYQHSFSYRDSLQTVPDTLLFIPYLHLGEIANRTGQYDSALYWFTLAADVESRYPLLAQPQRLYDPLADLYESGGHYQLARDLLAKKLRHLENNRTGTDLQKANTRLRLAKLALKLDDTDAAENHLKAIHPHYPGEVLLRLGEISLAESDTKQALNWLHQAGHYTKDFNRSYLMASVHFAMGNIDSANYYLETAVNAAKVEVAGNIAMDSAQQGRLRKLRGDILSGERRYQEAIEQYQQALIAFAPGFENAETDSNPSAFTGIFAYPDLFKTLAAKGDALERLYHQEKVTGLLVSSLSSYRTAWQLAEYVNQAYTPDETLRFTKSIQPTLKGKAVNICLSLYELTRKKSYLEEAWLYSQRSRLMGSPVKLTNSGSNDREGQIRTQVTRLLIQAESVKDSTGWATLRSTINPLETELGKIRLSGKETSSQVIPVTQLQKKLDNATALLSYHLSGTELMVLVVMASQLDYYKAPVTSEFFSEISEFRTALQQTPQTGRYNGTVPAMNLYETLLLPVYGNFSHIKRLVIIPDGALHGIPFEALQDENKEFLVEKFSIQYQYTPTLPVTSEDKEPLDQTLSFAPFSSTSFTDTTGYMMPGLPVSGAGLRQLKGNTYSDSAATKTNFTRNIQKHPVIHLSTYATIRDNDPSMSHITFYPGKPGFRLYSGEISQLDLHANRLLILDAAETGNEGLLTGKGLVQFTGEFAKAGCADIMLSLWRTEDKISAFISARVHEYLEDGYTNDRALRQAKLDIINSREIDSRYLNPGYWGNMIFVGEYDADHAGNKWRWVAVGVVAILLGYFFIKRSSGRKYKV